MVEFSFSLPKMDEAKFDQVANQVLDTAAEMARAEWIKLASASLNSTLADYTNGIQPVEAEGLTRTIRLEGKLPNMQEQGHEAYDMKPGLLGSDKAKTSKDGSRYMFVHMEHGSPMQTHTRKLPDDIWQRAKKMKMGDRLSDSKYFTTNVKGYSSKSGIYEGMRRSFPKGQQGNRNAFETFRTVSSKSDASAWWHPGFKALLLADKVKDFIEEQIQGIMDSYMKDVL